MHFGLGLGPDGSAKHRSSHYVYDVRSGSIIAAHHFAGARRESSEELHLRLSKQAHETSALPLDHLAVLSVSELPAGEGPLRVDPAAKRLVRTGERFRGRIHP